MLALIVTKEDTEMQHIVGSVIIVRDFYITPPEP
jgi:hypothetical protein